MIKLPSALQRPLLACFCEVSRLTKRIPSHHLHPAYPATHVPSVLYGCTDIANCNVVDAVNHSAYVRYTLGQQLKCQAMACKSLLQAATGLERTPLPNV